DLVALLEEAARVPDLELEVVRLDARPELDFFDVDLVLLLARLAGLAGLLVLELAVVHDSDHRRPRVRRHLHQVQALALGSGERFIDRHEAELCTLGADDPDRTDPDLPVHADSLLDRDCSSSRMANKKRPAPTGPLQRRAHRPASAAGGARS